MALVFERVAEAVQAMAGRSRGEVRVELVGAATPVDRRLAEALVDPVLQLARNAVAHGIESPDLRVSLGKPPFGRIVLSAEVRGAHLLVRVADDGAGVDLDALRAEAVRSGRLSGNQDPPIADEALLNLLFLPGMTTRTTADLLAGRGVGLDISLHAARRLGGTIRFRNHPGSGLTVVIDVPLVERGHARVLWVRSLGNRFALTGRHVLRARACDPDESPPPALAAWIDPALTGPESGYVIDVGRSADHVVSVSVSAIEGIEETPVRPVPPLIALAGPYVGVIVGADGHPSLLVDALLVVDRALRNQPARHSTFPPPARA
jgi:chemotaxis protein histidine kinase CheA